MESRLHNRIGSLRQLEILLAVYEEGGVSAAAEKLHLTQPTVSMQLKKLSDSLDVQLYERVGRGQVFTESGEAVIVAARDILSRFQDLDAQLADFRGMRAGTLRIAVVTTSKYFIPHLLGSFCDKYPDIDLQFRVGNREQIVERLHAGLDDLYVFSHPPENEDIAASDFLPNPLVAIAPEGHPLAQSKTLQLTDLAEHPFLMREPGSGTRFAIERFFRKTDVQLSVRMTIESNEAIKHAVMSGLGISILSAHTLSFGGRAGLCELKVKGLPIEARWYLVQQRQRSTSIPARAFLEYMKASGQVEALMKELSIGSD